jgi:hypothetical protein
MNVCISAPVCEFGMATMQSNVRGHRADEMKIATRSAASEAPGGPRG